METKLILFDLDGTLLDTIGDLAASCDYALKRNALPRHDAAAYRSFVGNGILRLVERAIPEERRDPTTVAAVRGDFIRYYTEHIDTFTRPYPGIPELLARLSQRGLQLAVLSNKFQTGTEKLVRIFFPSIPFVQVVGQREGVPLKPDPRAAREILAATGVAPWQAAMVGDSGVDMQTARASGIAAIGVTWGFRRREELVENRPAALLDTPLQLLDLLDGAAQQ